LWGLRPSASRRVEVTVPRRGSRRRPGLVIHAARQLPATQTSVHAGVPCTSAARTLLDLAGSVDSAALERALERSVVLRLFDGSEMEATLACAHGRRGALTLRRLLADVADDPPAVRSELERRFLRLVRRARLPDPLVNGWIAGHEVDFHWPAQRLVVETDGRATHGHAAAFERDRRRDLDLELAGWSVMRITWRQVTTEPQRVSAALRSRLCMI
jgi:very-short-patch-repair endonuclease